MSKRTDRYHGIMLLDKPVGISSHDAVDRVRKTLSQRTVGHTGTLDPAAEGLLVLMLGKATKVARFLTAQDKEYIAEIRLGLESTTYDSEGVDPNSTARPIPELTRNELEEVLEEFRGLIKQKVPPFSAVHVNGERLYKRSRKGDVPLETPERTVRIDELTLLSTAPDRLRLRVVCSKGTYIRSLAHDLGIRLGCGGHLSYLRRTRVGKLEVETANTFQKLDSMNPEDGFDSLLIPIDKVLDFSSLTVEDEFCRLLTDGVRPRQANIATHQGDFGTGDTVLVKDLRGSVLAIGTTMIPSSRLRKELTGDVLKYERVLR